MLEKEIQAILNPHMAVGKGEYIASIVEQIQKENEELQNALENDKFHIVGRNAGRIDDLTKKLKLALDVV